MDKVTTPPDELHTEPKPSHRTSVRALVEFILRSGDIDSGSGTFDPQAMAAGARVHKKLQSEAGGDYRPEVPFKELFTENEFTLTIEGRADGVYTSLTGRFLDKVRQTRTEGVPGQMRLTDMPGQMTLADIVTSSGEHTLADSPVQESQMEQASINPAAHKSAGLTPVLSEQAASPLSPSEDAAPPVTASLLPPSEEAACVLPFAPPETAIPSDQSALPASITVIDEIKGMYLDVLLLPAPIPVHLSQALCYAAMYLADHPAPLIGVRMTYSHLERNDRRTFYYLYDAEDVRTWFISIVREWEKWLHFQDAWIRLRNASMEDLTFPFPYREGQKRLVGAVYRTIEERKQLFLMAPTGVGKTMAVCYPSVRALGEGLAERIFYMTAKNQTLAAGEEAFAILREKGLKVKCTRITAKDKICPMSEAVCSPERCKRARGHFDRINDAVFTLLKQHDTFDQDTIKLAGEEFMVCPFELSLDLSSWSDVILCDYNYVFDPSAHLKRFIGDGRKGDYIFLADEAHNLVDRARDMYSASLVREHVLSARKSVGDVDKKLRAALSALSREMLTLKKESAPDGTETMAGEEKTAFRQLPSTGQSGETAFRILPAPGKSGEAALRVRGEMERIIGDRSGRFKSLKEDLLDFYFEIRNFTDVMEYLDDNYVVCTGLDEDENFLLRLACVNPADRLSSYAACGRSSVFFSATFLPISYYEEHLTTLADPYSIYAPSPFDPSHRCILIGSDVSTRYRSRGRYMYERIARYILTAARSRRGNYMAFFPSYKMMLDVLAVYREICDTDGINYVAQSRFMSDLDREIFMENFYEDPAETLIGFCVMGGMFSEGIDLTGSRLIGAIVVGCGLPQVSDETNMLRTYYDSRPGALPGDGFHSAFRIPGMNKVLQAAGRVIRTEEDRGVILLLDDRFLAPEMLAMLPREWRNYSVCTAETAANQLADFWQA